MLDTVLFVPTQVSPFKAQRTVTPAELRLTMLRLAVADNPAFSVSDTEVRRPGPSYTVDTLRHLATEYPAAERFFLTGTDAVRDLPRWREPEEILRLSRFLVMTRPGVEESTVLSALPDTFEERIAFIQMPGLDISSSFVRESLSQGRTVRYLVPDTVLEFIYSNRLYGCP
jgi:nicotinate-nucleotide adenylyltransferase